MEVGSGKHGVWNEDGREKRSGKCYFTFLPLTLYCEWVPQSVLIGTLYWSLCVLFNLVNAFFFISLSLYLQRHSRPTHFSRSRVYKNKIQKERIYLIIPIKMWTPLPKNYLTKPSNTSCQLKHSSRHDIYILNVIRHLPT